MAIATVDDVATTLGRSPSDLTAAETAQWTMWLDDAERQIRKRLGDVTLLDQADLAYVEREAVALKVKRPDPAQRVEISVDDARVARSYEKDTGQVTILTEWWELLAPEDEGTVFSVRPYFQPDEFTSTSLDWS